MLRPAWSTEMITQTGGRKLAAAGIAPPRRPAERVALPAERALPALRLARHRGDVPVRLDGVQGAVALPGLRRALRPGEAAVTATAVRTRKPRADLPPADRRRRRPAHRRRGGGHLRGAGGAARGLRVRAGPAPDRAPVRRRRRDPAVVLDLLHAALAWTAGLVRIGVREIAGGAFSRYAARELSRATRSTCCRRWATSPPISRPTRTRHYAAIVAGSGITPVLSLVATALETEPAEPVHPGLRQPARGDGDVRRRAGRPQGPLSATAAPGARAVPGAAGVGAAVRADRRRPAAGHPGQRAARCGQVDEWFLCGPYGMVDRSAVRARRPRRAAAMPYIPNCSMWRVSPRRPAQRRRAGRGGGRGDAHPGRPGVDVIMSARRAGARRGAAGAGRSCRTPARAACARPAGPGWSRARWRWRTTTRWSPTRSPPGTS